MKNESNLNNPYFSEKIDRHRFYFFRHLAKAFQKLRQDWFFSLTYLNLLLELVIKCFYLIEVLV